MLSAATITSAFGALTAFVTLLIAVLGVRSRVDKVGGEVAVVHKLVNARLSAVLDRVDQLADALTAAGVPVPSGTRLYDEVREERRRGIELAARDEGLGGA